MKNLIKELFILAVILFSYIVKTENTAYCEYNELILKNTGSAISSKYFNDKPLVISENNINQEISQSRNGNNNQFTIYNKHFYNQTSYNPKYILKKITKNKFDNNNYISSNLENIIYTRAP